MDKEQLRILKCDIFDVGLYDDVKRANRINFKYGDRSLKDALEAQYGVTAVKIATNMYNARYKRAQRVEQHIENLLTLPSCEWVFVTLTFTDKTFSRTTPKTRRRYVARWCKRVSALYVANIDYGSENEREHYHAILCNFVDTSSRKSWNRYGAVHFEKIRANSSKKAISKYITKLSLHALKETASRGDCRIIYSKNLHIDFSQEF